MKGAEKRWPSLRFKHCTANGLNPSNNVCTVCDVAGKPAPDAEALGQE
nr:hypothetical protein [Pseudomonas syringae pv. actinidiae]